MVEFIVGQRCISNTESELGLGIVQQVSPHRISIFFPATDEQRTYAKDNAPLTRVIIGVGEQLLSIENLSIKVSQIEENNGLLIYSGIDQSGQLHSISEVNLNHHIQFNKPQERLFSGQFDPASWFDLRYQTWQRLENSHKSGMRGLQGARVSLIGHQLYIAHEVAERANPRVMLADEVGLGKTIEAGLILQYRLINQLSRRVLIIVPESLLHQWLVEMLRRFNLSFSIIDEQRCVASHEENPFIEEQWVLCSQTFFRDYPLRQQQALEANWDLLIVDEAHHYEWNEQTPSQEYVFIEQLSRIIPALLLLTATPEQLGKESHFARLKLLDSDRFFDFKRFMDEERSFEPVASIAKKLLTDDSLNDHELDYLAEVLKQDDVNDLIVNVNQKKESVKVRQHLITLLLDHHGTGRILFRNARQRISGFPTRNCTGYSIGSREKEWPNIEESPYFDWLVAFIDRLQSNQEKALLICKQAETVVQLEQALRTRKGIASAVFHEGMSIIERDRAAAYFSDDEASVSILMCSEIGSEGRNFQFVHQLILFDLPFNPDLLQQRIGRLDRIGQTHTIEIHVPFIENSEQHILFRWFQDGFNLFQLNNEAASQIANELQPELLHLIENKTDQESIESFIQKTKQMSQIMQQQMHQGKDQLLELNSCRQEEANKLIANVVKADQDNTFWQYMESLFDCYGVDYEFHSESSFILKPSESLRISYFPLLTDEGITVTTHRAFSLAREDIHFLTQEHPMVVDAMDMVVSSETGNSAISVVKHPLLKGGQFLLELLFIIECSAPAELKISRYLPLTPVRVLIDQNLHDVSGEISYQSLLATNDKFDKAKISQFIDHQRGFLLEMIKKAEDKANGRMQKILSSSINKMQDSVTKEIERLIKLQKINLSIKHEEIDQLKQTIVLSRNNLEQSQLKLDAVRFIITN